MSAVEQTALSSVEQDRLAHEEAAIERGLDTFLRVGTALAAIRDQRLYRESHATFADYCQERWGLSRSRAYQMIEAADVSTNVDIGNEAQARALNGLDADGQRETWTRAQEQSGSEQPTAEQIKNARKASGAGSADAGPPPPSADPASDPDPEAKARADAQTDAETSRRVFSQKLAGSVHLLAVYGTKANAAKQAVADWEPGVDTYHKPTTAARMREAADYLYAVAEEWPA